MLFSVVPYCDSRLQDQNLQIVVKNSIIKIIPCIALLQSLTGLKTFSLAFNSVAWFLSTLFIIYWIAPSLAKLIKDLDGRYTLQMLLVNIVITVLAFSMFRFIESKTLFDDLSYGSPYFRIFFASDGMIIAKLFKEKKIHMRGVTSDLIVAIALTWVIIRNTMAQFVFPELLRMLDVMLCVLLVCALLDADGYADRLLSDSKLVQLGSATGFMFLIHYPIRQYIGMLIGHHDISTMIGIVSGLCIFILTICISEFYKIRVQGKIKF